MSSCRKRMRPGWERRAPGPLTYDVGSGRPENDFTNRNTTFMTWNLMHLARMLRLRAGLLRTVISAPNLARASRARRLPAANVGPEAEVKGRAASQLTLGPDLSAVLADDPRGRCQAQSRSGEFPYRVQPFKRLENSLPVTVIEAHAVVVLQLWRTAAGNLKRS